MQRIEESEEGGVRKRRLLELRRVSYGREGGLLVMGIMGVIITTGSEPAKDVVQDRAARRPSFSPCMPTTTLLPLDCSPVQTRPDIVSSILPSADQKSRE
jgi:hypothetical protein